MAKKTTKKAPARRRRVAAGVGTATSSGQARTDISEKAEAAMSQAVKDALNAGVSLDNSAELRKRMAAARDRVLAEHG